MKKYLKQAVANGIGYETALLIGLRASQGHGDISYLQIVLLTVAVTAIVVLIEIFLSM